MQSALYSTADTIAAGVAAMGPFELIHDGSPDHGIAAVSWRLKEGTDPGWNLYDLADRMRTRGWLVPAYSLPSDLDHLSIQRVLIRHGFSRELADTLLADPGRQRRHARQAHAGQLAHRGRGGHGLPQRQGRRLGRHQAKGDGMVEVVVDEHDVAGRLATAGSRRSPRESQRRSAPRAVSPAARRAGSAAPPSARAAPGRDDPSSTRRRAARPAPCAPPGVRRRSRPVGSSPSHRGRQARRGPGRSAARPRCAAAAAARPQPGRRWCRPA